MSTYYVPGAVLGASHTFSQHYQPTKQYIPIY